MVISHAARAAAKIAAKKRAIAKAHRIRKTVRPRVKKAVKPRVKKAVKPIDQRVKRTVRNKDGTTTRYHKDGSISVAGPNWVKAKPGSIRAMNEQIPNLRGAAKKRLQKAVKLKVEAARKKRPSEYVGAPPFSVGKKWGDKEWKEHYDAQKDKGAAQYIQENFFSPEFGPPSKGIRWQEFKKYNLRSVDRAIAEARATPKERTSVADLGYYTPTSRNPEITPKFLKEFRESGLKVKGIHGKGAAETRKHLAGDSYGIPSGIRKERIYSYPGWSRPTKKAPRTVAGMDKYDWTMAGAAGGMGATGYAVGKYDKEIGEHVKGNIKAHVKTGDAAIDVIKERRDQLLRRLGII